MKSDRYPNYNEPMPVPQSGYRFNLQITVKNIPVAILRVTAQTFDEAIGKAQAALIVEPAHDMIPDLNID